ncbi:hypothetical protein DRN69_09350 [Candidatus Pacearchaeota archaeon]|nr:MAG: hypothetical protein DRN69_09350 [Candidatus Pacearchaeota archaeon]
MSVSYWQVYILGSGDSWVSDGQVPRPNDDLSTPLIANMTQITLADGSKAFIFPETKSVKDSITFVWLKDDGTVKEKIEDYIENGTKVKIVTHYTGIEFIGYFSSITPFWRVGQSPDEWNLQVVFSLVD